MTSKRIIQIETKVGEDTVSQYKLNLFTDNSNKKHEDNVSCQTVELNLNILNEPVLFRIDVVPTMIKLSEIVPLARELSSKISDIIRSRLSNDGTSIPCRKGCSFCCGYLVPLSIPEAFRLREEVNSMPENTRKEVLKSFLASAGKILDEKPENLNLLEIKQLGEWYSDLELTCPILSENTCSMYDKRPVVCREYLVTDSELFCTRQAQQIDSHKVDLPVSIVEALGSLSAELEQTDTEAIMMPLALPWAEENLNRDLKKYPALETVQRLIEIIQELSNKTCLITSR